MNLENSIIFKFYLLCLSWTIGISSPCKARVFLVCLEKNRSWVFTWNIALSRMLVGRAYSKGPPITVKIAQFYCARCLLCRHDNKLHKALLCALSHYQSLYSLSALPRLPYLVYSWNSLFILQFISLLSNFISNILFTWKSFVLAHME